VFEYFVQNKRIHLFVCGMAKFLDCQSVGNIVLFEHINLEVPDALIAMIFYIEGLGLTKDPFQRPPPSVVLWVNAGFQQFHIITNKNGPAQVINGHVGLIVPNLTELMRRLTSVEKKLQHTKFSWSKKGFDPKMQYNIPLSPKASYVDVVGPFGNNFRVFEYDMSRFPFRGGLGIAYVELESRKDKLKDIKDFYSHFMGALVDQIDEETLSVCVGPLQQLVFRATDKETIPYNGYHFAIYLATFEITYNLLNKHGLLFTQHKFSDRCETLRQALDNSQFRVRDVPSAQGGVVFQLELEVRSLVHPSFMRPLVNRIGGVGINCCQ